MRISRITVVFSLVLALVAIAAWGQSNAKASGVTIPKINIDTSSINFDELNTAAESWYMTTEERQMVRELNFVRKYPQVYAGIVAQYLTEQQNSMEMQDDELRVGLELIEVLRNEPSLSVLQPKECVYNASKSHGMYQAKTGQIGHAGYNSLYPEGRLKITCGKVEGGGENLVAGLETVRASLLSLLIDFGIADRGHRHNILNPEWKYVGCHKANKVGEFEHSWVQNFTN